VAYNLSWGHARGHRVGLETGCRSTQSSNFWLDTLPRPERLKKNRLATATAHKIARILYHVLSTKEPYTETVFHLYDEQAHQRAEMRLRKQAARLGFQLLPIPATGE